VGGEGAKVVRRMGEEGGGELRAGRGVELSDVGEEGEWGGGGEWWGGGTEKEWRAERLRGWRKEKD